MIHVSILSSNNTEIVDCYGIDKCMEILNKNKSIQATKIDICDIYKLTNNNTDVLIIAGGEPRQIKLHLKGKGSQSIRNFISNGGGYVGICAGAVLAIPKSPSLELLQHVKTVNDNVWWDSGIYGDIKLKSCIEQIDKILKQNDVIGSICNKFNNTNLFAYKNGPLFNIKQSKKKLALTPIPLATFNGPLYYANQTISNKLSTEINDSIAIILGKYNKGLVMISSIHPEYGDDENLLIEMCVAVTQK